MKKYDLLTLFGFAFSSVTYASEHQIEIEADITFSELELENQRQTVGLKGTYYLTPVQHTSSPINEAAFQQKISSIFVKNSTITSDDYDFENTIFSGGGRFVIADKFSLEVDYSKKDATLFSDTTSESGIVNFNVGYYFADSHEVKLGYTRIDRENNYPGSIWGAAEADTEISGLKLGYHGVFNKNSHAIVFDASYAYLEGTTNYASGVSSDNDHHQVSLGVTYYPTNKLGIYTKHNHEVRDKGDGVFNSTFGADYQVTEKFSLGGEIFSSNGDLIQTDLNSNTDNEGLKLTSKFRF